MLGTAIGALFTGVCFALFMRQHRRPAALPAASDFDEEAEIALHVGLREATSRGVALAPAHVLFGLLQVDAFTRALAGTGAEPGALEARVLDALDARAPEGPRLVERLARAAAGARASGRTATCADVWRYVAHSSASSLLAGVDVHAVLFQLAHGTAEPPDALPEREVHVVLRNDHYTPMAFVTAVLRDELGLPEPEAAALMQRTHEHGRVVLGRFASDAARAKIQAVRARARAAAFPLWIGVEPW